MIFVFIACLKQLLGTTKFGGLCPPGTTGLRKAYDQSFTKGNVRNDERLLSTLSTLLKQVHWMHKNFCAKKWEQNINHCYFIRLCFGFHVAKFSQDSSSSGMKYV